jgi:hypothetical protein
MVTGKSRHPHAEGDPDCLCANCGYARGGHKNAAGLNTPEMRAASAERMRARWADPAWRAAQIARLSGPKPVSFRIKMRLAALEPAEQARRSARMTAQREDPAFLAAMTAALAAPEVISLQNAARARARNSRRLELGLTEAEYAEYRRLQKKLKLASATLVSIIKDGRRVRRPQGRAG